MDDHRIQRLSRELGDASKAAAVAMDATTTDGLPSTVITIVVDTPLGRVVGLPIPASAADEIRESIESGIERLQQLRLDTESGSTVIPGTLLRQSLIRFQHGPVEP